jgi:8-oxo-dGTP pyrophosphatase MutT (NUDIX family)
MTKPPAIEDIHHHYGGVFLITPDKKVVGQHRDDKVGIDNPGRVGPFGGAVEPGEEPLTAAWRELVKEETNLSIPKQDIHHLCDEVAWRELTEEWEVLHCYYTYIDQRELENLDVYEGQGWKYITGPDDPQLSAPAISIVKKLFQALSL